MTKLNKRTWTITLPNGKTMKGWDETVSRDATERTGHIILSQGGQNAGSMDESVWLDGVEKMRAAGATVEMAEEAFYNVD